MSFSQYTQSRIKEYVSEFYVVTEIADIEDVSLAVASIALSKLLDDFMRSNPRENGKLKGAQLDECDRAVNFDSEEIEIEYIRYELLDAGRFNIYPPETLYSLDHGYAKVDLKAAFDHAKIPYLHCMSDDFICASSLTEIGKLGHQDLVLRHCRFAHCLSIEAAQSRLGINEIELLSLLSSEGISALTYVENNTPIKLEKYKSVQPNNPRSSILTPNLYSIHHEAFYTLRDATPATRDKIHSIEPRFVFDDGWLGSSISKTQIPLDRIIIEYSEIDRVLEGASNESTEQYPKDAVSVLERESMLKLIWGMARAKYDYNPSNRRNKATGTNAGSIQSDLDQMGLSLTDDTIRKYLKEADSLFSTTG